MDLCQICKRPNCLGIGYPDHRDGVRCAGTIETECHPGKLSEKRLEEIVEYQLECFAHSRAGRPFNGRLLLSLVKEIRELRQLVKELKE